MSNEKIFVQDGNNVKELLGAELQTFLDDQIDRQLETQARADAQTAKQIARQAVLNKLGLTADEAAALLG